MRKSIFAFTLIELIVTLGITAVLAVLVLTQVKRSVEQAKSTRGLNNLKQIGVAALLYAADNNGQLPQSSHQGPAKAWTRTLKDYLPGKLFVSPLDQTGRTLSYAINDFVTERPYGAKDLDFSRLQSQPTPAKTLFIAVLEPGAENSDHFHFADSGFSAAAFAGEVWVELIQQSSQYLFVDGHAEQLGWTQVQSERLVPGSTFIRPDGQN